MLFKDKKVSENKALEILQFWEKHLIGFSYECILKCPKCKKYCMDLTTKSMIEKEGKCNLCCGRVVMRQPHYATNTDKKKTEAQKRKKKSTTIVIKNKKRRRKK